MRTFTRQHTGVVTLRCCVIGKPGGDRPQSSPPNRVGIIVNAKKNRVGIIVNAKKNRVGIIVNAKSYDARARFAAVYLGRTWFFRRQWDAVTIRSVGARPLAGR